MVRKEVACEIRSPHGLMVGGLFATLAVIAISVASYNIHLAPTLAAGLYWVVALMAVVTALPRTFILEEEQGTGDMLRLTGDPFAIYWGKLIFNGGVALITNSVAMVLFLLFTSVPVKYPMLAVASLVAGTVALAGAVTLCGSLSARAANRYALASAIALALTIPTAFWGVSSLRAALGDGFFKPGEFAAIGLFFYGVVNVVIGPFIYSAVWKV